MCDISPQLESGDGFESNMVHDYFNNELIKHHINPLKTVKSRCCLLINLVAMYSSQNQTMPISQPCAVLRVLVVLSLADVELSIYCFVAFFCERVLKYVFDLHGRFCDADELKTSWQNIKLLEAMSLLLYV